MPSVFDVASYILRKHPSITAMKLQKLVYFAQAWSLVWDGEALFPEELQAWANGPVVPELYAAHRGKFKIDELPGDPDNLDAEQRATVDGVLDFYVRYTSQQLSDLTHSENPWRSARSGLADGERGENIISLASMEEYYSSIPE